MAKGKYNLQDFAKTTDKLKHPSVAADEQLSPVDMGLDFVKSTDTIPVIKVNPNWKQHDNNAN